MAPPSDQHEHRAGCSEPNGSGLVRPSPPSVFEHLLQPDWAAPSLARDRFDGWLRAHRWPPASREDMVLAVSEAVSNSVEHGYQVALSAVNPSGTVAVRASIKFAADLVRWLEIEIRDQGRWHPAAEDRSMRGHGLLIIRACVDQMTIEGSATGTTISLTSRPVPLPNR